MPDSRVVRARLLIITLSVVLLTACRVDTNIDVAMVENGSGVITITAVADAELVARAPGLADDLRLDDVVAAGWVVEGPAATADGGLSLVLKHAFDTPEEATALLASVNGPDGPLLDVTLARKVFEREVELSMTGFAGATAGLASFADPDLLASVGATPWAAELAESGVPPADALALTVSADLEGEMTSTAGTPGDDGRIRWTVPFDETLVDLSTTSSVSLAKGGAWAVIPYVALAAFVAWVLAAVFVVWRLIVVRRFDARARRVSAQRPR